MTPTAELKRGWHLIDANNKILGRTAVQVARALSGRGKSNWCRIQDVGDHVVVVNCSKIRVTGKKATSKKYYHHTRYLGHLKTKSYSELMIQKPTEVMRHAVVGMLPDNRLKKGMLRRLHLYPGSEHPFAKHFSV
ncbi:MAG: 50S ribosomal protein L13 [Parcubacteria group bacterium]